MVAHDALVTDEVGICIARLGPFRVKTAYQPIWRHRDGMLLPEAVEALARPFLDGRPISPIDFFAEISPHERFRTECVCRALHLHNHVNIGVPSIVLFFNYDPRVNGDGEQAISQLNYMAERLANVGIDIRLLVCEITETDALDRNTFVRLAAEIRRLGMRLAIDDFGAGHSTLGRVQIVEPDVIKFDGAFFRRVIEEPAALSLLSRLVDGFKRGGAQIVFEGLETPRQLLAALDAGGDLFQGFLLGRPALAGTPFDHQPVPVDHFAGSDMPAIRVGAGI
jgi:EAL domain-containing protein (putative c-di-GMP-specific phosphodiesterase class I)